MRIDLGFSLAGDQSAAKYYRHIHRRDVEAKINSHPALDPWTRERLVARLKGYPDNALGYFVANINQMVLSVLKERAKMMADRVVAKREAKKDVVVPPPRTISLEREIFNEESQSGVAPDLPGEGGGGGTIETEVPEEEG